MDLILNLPVERLMAICNPIFTPPWPNSESLTIANIENELRLKNLILMFTILSPHYKNGGLKNTHNGSLILLLWGGTRLLFLMLASHQWAYM